MGLFARARDGRVGWLHPVRFNSADGKAIEIELRPGRRRPGPLTDQNARPIAGVEVKPVLLRPSGNANSGDYIRLSPEVTALFRTTTAADGSFVLKGIPQGAGIFAAIAAPAFGSPAISWDTTQAGDDRPRQPPGTDQGPAQAARCAWVCRIRSASGLHRAPSPDRRRSRPIRGRLCFKAAAADKDGAFQFDGLPPGRYMVNAYFDQDGIIATKPQHEVEVGPGAVAQLEIPLQRLPTITGRVVDAQTGKGIAGVGLNPCCAKMGRTRTCSWARPRPTPKGGTRSRRGRERSRSS